MAAIGAGRFTFTATGGAGVYAVEEYGIGVPQTALTQAGFRADRQGIMPVSKLVFSIDSAGAATGYQVEVWVLLTNTNDPSTAGNWALWSTVAAQLGTAINTPVEINMALYPGVKLRCKAGAGAGSPTGMWSAEGYPL